jgi:hypothetical protein
MEDVDSLAIDTDADEPASKREKQEKIGRRGLAAGLGLKR